MRQAKTRGFTRTSSLLQKQIRRASESRGFAESRLLTHWAEFVGEDIAAVTRPVKVSYPKGGGLGATLTLLTTGAQAPMLEMQKERIRERVNTCYGYSAIARVHITQTAATGFAEGQADFAHRKPAPAARPAPAPQVDRAAREAARPLADEGLRTALEQLARNVLGREAAREAPAKDSNHRET